MKNTFSVSLGERGLMRVDERDPVAAELRLQIVDRGLNILDIEFETTPEGIDVVVCAPTLARSMTHFSFADREMQHFEDRDVETPQKSE